MFCLCLSFCLLLPCSSSSSCSKKVSYSFLSVLLLVIFHVIEQDLFSHSEISVLLSSGLCLSLLQETIMGPGFGWMIRPEPRCGTAAGKLLANLTDFLCVPSSSWPIVRLSFVRLFRWSTTLSVLPASTYYVLCCVSPTLYTMDRSC